MATLPTVNAFWVGPKLGALHAACLASFAAHGHRVKLHTYGTPLEGVPDVVEIADASKTLSRDKIVRHRQSGSLALASDLFRYELMAAEAGIYADCDCYCVKPIVDTDLIFGRESDQNLGTAVLKLPPDNPLLSAMRSIGTSRGFIPPWETSRKRKKYKLRSAIGRPVPISKMRWGTMGPIAITYYAKKLGMIDKAKPIDEFYPLHYHHVGLLRDPSVSLDDLITPRTKIVHLWNEFLRKDDRAPPPGSPLAEIINS